MAETYGARLNKHQEQSLEEMVAQGDADNTSEALRMALDSGLAELGYQHGQQKDTRLRRLLRRAADAFGLAALVWVGLTFLYPIGFRMWAIPLFTVAVGLYVADRGLARHEPAVSQRLGAFFGTGGENA